MSNAFLTRTQTTLVVSSMEPHSGAEASWWQRLEGSLHDAPWADGTQSDHTAPSFEKDHNAHKELEMPPVEASKEVFELLSLH